MKIIKTKLVKEEK